MDEQRSNTDNETALDLDGKKRWVINLSSRQLTEEETKVLRHGFNFAPAPRNIPKEDIIAGVEVALRRQHKLPDETAEHARAAVANIIRKAKPPQPNTTKEEREAMKRLQRDRNITILCADKGNATVVLDSKNYEEKAMELLERPPFKKVQKNPTTRNEKKVNNRIKKLSKNDPENRDTFQSLQVPCNGTKPALFYGSVKIHKQGYPLRPIVSAVGSATYHVSRYVSRILSTYAEEVASFIRNSSDLSKRSTA